MFSLYSGKEYGVEEQHDEIEGHENHAEAQHHLPVGPEQDKCQHHHYQRGQHAQA